MGHDQLSLPCPAEKPAAGSAVGPGDKGRPHGRVPDTLLPQSVLQGGGQEAGLAVCFLLPGGGSGKLRVGGVRGFQSL